MRPSRPPLRADPGWRAVAAAFAFNGLLFGVWASRIPTFKRDFALDPGALGLLLLALAAGAISFFALAGALSERMGPARVTLLCALAYGPALLLLPLAPSLSLLTLALFGFGAVHGAMDVAMNGWAAEVETRLGRPTMSIFHALFSLGAAAGAASGYGAIGAGLPPLAHFALVAIPGAALALALIAPQAPTRAPDPTQTQRPRFRLPSGSLVLVGLIAFAVSVGEGAMADWSAVFLRLVTGTTEAQAALGYAAFSATMVLTRLSGGLLVERFGPVRTARLSGLLAACGLALVILAPGLGTALAGFALTGIGYAVVIPLAFSRAAQDSHMRPGPALASVATLGYGGLLLGPVLVGAIAELGNLRLSFTALALLALVPVPLAAHLRIRSTPAAPAS